MNLYHLDNDVKLIISGTNDDEILKITLLENGITTILKQKN